MLSLNQNWYHDDIDIILFGTIDFWTKQDAIASSNLHKTANEIFQNGLLV